MLRISSFSLSCSLGKKASDVPSSRSIWLDDLQAPTADTFRIDKKPDPANWAYKSLYRGDIARYWTLFSIGIQTITVT